MSQEWKCVPVISTPEMQQAPFIGTIQTQSLTDQMRRHARIAAEWEKMLAAAPATDLVPVSAAELAALRTDAERLDRMEEENWHLVIDVKWYSKDDADPVFVIQDIYGNELARSYESLRAAIDAARSHSGEEGS